MRFNAFMADVPSTILPDAYFTVISKKTITLAFICFIIAANSIRLFANYACIQASALIGKSLSLAVYRKILSRSFQDQINSNSSDIIATCTSFTTQATQSIGFVFQLISSIIVSIFITLGLCVVSPINSALMLIILGTVYASVGYYSKRRLKRNSQIVAKAMKQQTKIIQESLNDIKSIILYKIHGKYSSLYKTQESIIRELQAENQVFNILPRYAIETLGLVLIALISYKMTSTKEAFSAIASIGALVLGLQKLLPALQQIYYCYAVTHSMSASVRELDKHLSIPTTTFEAKLYKDEVSFSSLILRDAYCSFNDQKGKCHKSRTFNVDIYAGENIALVGPSGAGKSTLMNIIMGLLPLASGHISINNKEIVVHESLKEKKFLGHQPSQPTPLLAIQSLIAHVPQNPVLLDCSILENITLSDSAGEVDLKQLDKALVNAACKSFVESMPDGIHTRVGESGCFLSGGQAQRIAIARALYLDKSILVLDESTSNLDQQTELKIIKSILDEYQDKTVIMCTHSSVVTSLFSKKIVLS